MIMRIQGEAISDDSSREGSISSCTEVVDSRHQLIK